MTLVTRPLYLQPRLLALVFVGGGLGALLRWSIAEGTSNPYLPIAMINLSGSLLLGLLLGALAALGPDDGPRRQVRLLLGTGFLGGFTTYSTFSGHAVLITLAQDTPLWLLYSFGSVFGGLALAGVGLWLGGLTGRRILAARSGRPA